MATLYISEYSKMGASWAEVFPIPAPLEPSVAEQSIAIGAGSVQSAAFNGATRVVRVHPDSICSIAFGLNPTAVTTKKRVAAGASEFFCVEPGHKVAVIDNSYRNRDAYRTGGRCDWRGFGRRRRYYLSIYDAGKLKEYDESVTYNRGWQRASKAFHPEAVGNRHID